MSDDYANKDERIIMDVEIDIPKVINNGIIDSWNDLPTPK